MSANAVVRVGYPWWLRPFVFRDVLAITLGRRIWIAEGHASERLIRHEMTHIRQAARLGLMRFWWRYLAEYVRHRRSGLQPSEAYRRISFEVEAFAAEEAV